MQFIDILRTQSLDKFIQVEQLMFNRDKTTRTKRTGIMKVGNMKWESIRHFEYKNVCQIVPCEKNGKKYLFIQVDDKEKSFFDR